MMRRGRAVLLTAIWIGMLCASRGVRADAPQRIDFGRDVQPILSEKCYFCHGPDEAARKGKLRLDTQEGAFRVLDGKAAIVPGKTSESDLVRRITSHDPDVQMPPPKSNRALSAQQIDILQRWIEQGAKWGVHWSFAPIANPAPPAPADPAWSRNAIDAFILARLSQEKLGHSPIASKEMLIRRATLDLTGLPPTPAEVDAFVADQSPDAYEKVIDRLLASPRYGERMASDWLDVARYADTHGYQADRYRDTWTYRDWVIKAFNQNLPYDQFGTWQLSGDLLPNATKEQRLATSFNRLHMQNEEGGIIEEEYRVAYVVDRVDTMGTAFLGLTFECSRCHDHKFDPITQKDFYSLFSLFQNIDESGQTVFFTSAMPVPTMLLSSDEQDKKLADLHAKIADKQRQLHDLIASAGDAAHVAPDFAGWLAGRSAAPAPDPLVSKLVGNFSFDAMEKGQLANSADPAKPGSPREGVVLTPGKNGTALALSGENGAAFPGIGHFSRVDPFSISMSIRTPTLDVPRMVVLHQSMAPIDAGSRGYEVLLENGRIAFGLHHMWPRDSMKVVTISPVKVNDWTSVTITYDGCSRAAGVHIYLDGAPAELQVVRDGLFKDIKYGGNEPDLTIGYRFRDNGFKGGSVDDFRVFAREVSALEAAQLAGKTDLADAWKTLAEQLSPSQRSALADYYVHAVSPAGQQIQTELHALRTEENNLITPIPEAMVMEEMPTPKPAFVLKRGQYDAPGEPVTGNTPGFLPALAADQPHNRLGLARWMFSPSNPLTARVAVNRLWQIMFGRGIVETSENFGNQGSVPTHPELLDFLAQRYIASGWDTKATLKLMAMSATYQQSTIPTPELATRDPENLLLGRAPARRLTAEMLRDQALFDAGLLAERLGGPSVKPYQPDGIWDVAAGSPRYDQGHGDDLHRRSLYTYWKRTVPPPAMIAFDAAARSVCSARRQSTSTPTQALTLLNDTQIIEAARLAGQRMLKEGGPTDDARIAWMFHLITDRTPGEREMSVLRQLLHEQHDVFAADPKAATQLLTIGEAKNDPMLNPIDLSAATVLAQALFNYDEAVMRR